GELRLALPPTLTIEVRLTQCVNGKTLERLHGTVACEPGRLHVLGEVRRRPAVIDYDVEIAQASMCANPRVLEARTGVMVAIRPQLAPSGAWALLETIARVVDGTDEQIDTGHPGLGPIDRLPMDISETGRIVLVRPGARTVQRWSGELGEFELTLATQWRLPQPVRPGGHDLGIFTVRGDLEGFRSVPVRRDDQVDDSWDPEREYVWGRIEEIAGENARWLDLDEDEGNFDGQRFIATDRAMWAIGAAVTPWFEAMTGGTDLELRCFDVGSGAAWPTDGTTADDVRPLGSTRLSQVNGTWSATAQRREYSIIRDWDVEVAQSARIPDPRCSRVSSGLALNVRRIGDDLEVDGELSRIIDRGSRRLTLSAPIFMPEIHNVGATGGGNTARAWQNDSPAMGLIADEVLVEHPTIVSIPLRFHCHLDGNAPAVFRTAATDLLGPGRELLVEVRRAR
ncbi:MAG: hypothetical protein KDC98_11175, partial [Planctomycetes bacterium]|nr:hypothetical protein [Planctomycetota bacterium]